MCILWGSGPPWSVRTTPAGLGLVSEWCCLCLRSLQQSQLGKDLFSGEGFVFWGGLWKHEIWKTNKRDKQVMFSDLEVSPTLCFKGFFTVFMEKLDQKEEIENWNSCFLMWGCNKNHRGLVSPNQMRSKGWKWPRSSAPLAARLQGFELTTARSACAFDRSARGIQSQVGPFPAAAVQGTDLQCCEKISRWERAPLW